MALILGGAALFGTAVSGSGQQSSLVAPTGLLVALCLVIGPWIWRLAQERDAERLARIRAQERAEMAARVHDSVLQTLALIQRSADDPQTCRRPRAPPGARAARWLYGDRAGTGGETFGRGARGRAADVEELQAIRVEIVQTGDVPARRPACTPSCWRHGRRCVNAAIHAGVVGGSSVFVQIGDGEVAVYVRDRGDGFDRPQCPPIAAASRSRSSAGSPVAAVKRSVHSTPGDGHGSRAPPTAGGRVVKPRRRLVLVDDHRIFRAGVRSELDRRHRGGRGSRLSRRRDPADPRPRSRRRAARRPPPRRRWRQP